MGGFKDEVYDFPVSWEWNNQPNWRTRIFQRGRSTTNQITMIINDTAMISWHHIIYNNTCRYLQIRQFNMASYLFRCEHMASILIAIHHGSRQPNSSRYKNQVVSGVKFLQLCDNLLISVAYGFLTKSTCTIWDFRQNKPLNLWKSVASCALSDDFFRWDKPLRQAQGMVKWIIKYAIGYPGVNLLRYPAWWFVTVCYWKSPFIVDFPIQHGDFP